MYDFFQINRFQEPGSQGLLCDLLWSDPIVKFGHEQEPSAHGPRLQPGTTFIENQTRGCSYFFTSVLSFCLYCTRLILNVRFLRLKDEAACQFLERNKLLGIIRGHEAQDAG